MMFEKFKPQITDSHVYTFQSILLYLPNIDGPSNFETVLNYEFESEKNK